MSEVETVATITGVDRAAWDRLAGDNVMLGHGYLKTIEEAWVGEVERVYFLIRGPDRLEAAAACHVDDAGSKAESLDDLLLGRIAGAAARLGISFRPAFACGFPWSTGPGCLTDPDLDPSRRDELLGLLVEAIEQEAFRRRRLVAFLSVTDDETPLVRQLRRRSYARAEHAPLYSMDIEWSSFAEYRNALTSRKARKSVRREMNQNRKRGVVLREIEDPAACEGRLHELADRHFRRYAWPEFPCDRTWFSRLTENLGPGAVITVARRGDAITGVAVSLRRQGTCYPILACVDHDLAGNDFSYFTLGIYRPIAESIRRGDRRLVIGPGQHFTKSRRGFKPLATHLYCKSPRAAQQLGLGLWLRVISWWMRRR